MINLKCKNIYKKIYQTKKYSSKILSKKGTLSIKYSPPFWLYRDQPNQFQPQFGPFNDPRPWHSQEDISKKKSFLTLSVQIQK